LPDIGNIRNLIVVGRVFAFRHLVDVSISAVLIPADQLEMIHLLQTHGDTLETVSDLDCGHIQNNPARLLEVGELGDFLPIQPDFPAQSPGGKCGRFPVVFHEADIMLCWVNAQCKQ